MQRMQVCKKALASTKAPQIAVSEARPVEWPFDLEAINRRGMANPIVLLPRRLSGRRMVGVGYVSSYPRHHCKNRGFDFSDVLQCHEVHTTGSGQ
jgi:hypothetical protein